MSSLLNIKYKHLISNLLPNLNEYNCLERIIYLHNYILSTVEYPNIKLFKLFGIKYPAVNIFNKKERDYSSILGVLINKKAFCIGIAKTLNFILNNLNIKNKIVVGYVNSKEKGKIIHTWNIVYLNGFAYHLDTTFDITRNPNAIKSNANINELPSIKSIGFSKEFLLVSDEKIQVSHVWNKRFYPCCKENYPKDEIIKTIKKLESNDVRFIYT